MTINRLGAIDNDCLEVGDEYNPLTEYNDWGFKNPYQDPSRGKFENFSADDTGAILNLQYNLL